MYALGSVLAVYSLLIVGAAALALNSSVGIAFIDREEQLVATLLNQPRMSSVRPTNESGKPVFVEVTLPFVGIVDINEKNGEMTSTLFPRMKWIDPRLTWSVADYPNITELMLPVSDIWIPDIEVYNRYDDINPDNAVLPLAFVLPNGEVTYIPRRHMRTVCHFNLVKFPFDRQECSVVMGSWGYDVNKINITTSQINYSAFNVFDITREWDYESVNVSRFEEYRPDVKATFATIRLSFGIVRRSSYFYRLFVAPGAIVMFAIPVVHFSPAGSSEKLTLCGSMLIGVTVMFSMLEDFFPSHSVAEIPIILHYYSSVLLLLYVSMIMACVSASMANPGTKTSRVPPLLRKIFIEKLGYLCCVSGRASTFDHQLLHLERYIVNGAGSHDDTGFHDHPHHDDEDDAGVPEAGDETSAIVGGSSQRQQSRTTTSRGAARSSDRGAAGDSATKAVQALITEMQYARFITVCRLEWQQLSLTFDRIAGFLFFILAIIVTAATVNKAM